MTGLDPLHQAVITAVGSAVGGVLAAPIRATGDELVQRMRTRLQRTLDKWHRKAGGEPQRVHDRIAYNALREAALTDDEIASDYLGGVLAASGPDDDSGAAVVALIGRLSARQLLLHYVIYREVRRLWPTAVPLNLHMGNEASRAGIRLPPDDLARLFPNPELTLVMGWALPELHREGLIADQVEWTPERGLEVRPTAAGAALFLWGHGVSCPHATHLTQERVHGQELVFLAEVLPTPGAELLQPPTPAAGGAA